VPIENATGELRRAFHSGDRRKHRGGTMAKPKVQPINPYLTISGAAEAIAFYERAFGAVEKQRMPAQDGKRVLHADLSINGGTVMLSDEFPEHGGPAGPTASKPPPVAIAIQYAKPAEVDATFQRAVAAGCTSTMEPQDTFWEARFAMLVDPFGHRWMLNAPLPKKKSKRGSETEHSQA
jgi:PhnB protein